ncbi:hypothetical protein OKW26_001551 [Paraburkholderia sp. 32]
MSSEHQFDGFACGGELRVGEGTFAKQRRVTGRDEQSIARAQRHVEALGEMHDHFPAR